jgi:hypothetical protein
LFRAGIEITESAAGALGSRRLWIAINKALEGPSGPFAAASLELLHSVEIKLLSALTRTVGPITSGNLKGVHLSRIGRNNGC